MASFGMWTEIVAAVSRLRLCLCANSRAIPTRRSSRPAKNLARPQLQAALEFCREGDTLVVHSMDRLARNLADLRKLVTDLTARAVAVEFVKEHLTFTGEDSPMANLLLSMLGAVAEFERALILERQREGIAIAKAEGKYKGGQFKLSGARAAELRKCAAKENKAALAREFGISRQSLYSYLKAD